MSFCRITGRSRGLPKPNYFPLLPPISPADAKRFCRITGKSYGLPTHHYIPVVLGFHKQNKDGKNKKCKITTKSCGLPPHHYTAGLLLGEKKKHVVLKDFRYVFPIFDNLSEQQVALRNLLESKELLEEEKRSKFVYTVEERRCSLVFPAPLEAAVRDGDIRDVMLSKNCDSVLLRLKHGKNVSVDFCDLKEFDELYDGCGPREDIFKERQKFEAESKKRKKKRQEGLTYAKKIFEDKEKAAEEEELKIAKQVKLRSVREEKKKDRLLNWKQIGVKKEKLRQNIISNSCEWKKPLNHSFDWENLKDDKNHSKSEYALLVKQMPVPISINPQTIDLDMTPLGTYNEPISDKTNGLEIVTVIEPFTPLVSKPDICIQEAIKNISAKILEDTMNVNEKLLSAGEDALHILPQVNEIPQLIECMKAGKNAKFYKIKGLQINVASVQKFIPGQIVHTANEDVFVPGQTLQTKKGNSFVPGLTVQTPDGPTFIPGQIISIREEGNKISSVFVAGQTLPTMNGEEFVQGQTIHTSEGSKFITGQTVLTKEGPKFVAGQVVNGNKFVPGQLVKTQEGMQFIPGQIMTDELGQPNFIPGQSHQVNGIWDFIPGQCLKMQNGLQEFIPGQTMLTTSGFQFVPGQFVITEAGESHFIPGMTVKSENGDKFIAGMVLTTPEGIKFVEGQIVNTSNEEKFIPGATNYNELGYEFSAARNMKEVNVFEPPPIGIPIDPKTASAMSIKETEIFGYIIQTETSIEFIPESLKKCPQGKKMIPGQLVQNKDGSRFVPGIMTDDGFLPGQMVNTETGEKFIPGQVIDTSSGPKFVPGQMVETRSGLKFVPGQTIDTADGPQFIPGQIVDTKVGPTFIPGQVISTEDEGSRFVPGQVVNTSEGPRFVPGRVMESNEHGIVFVPGQIVQTEEGPRFIAPDLINTPEGELEFSVQGFEVTPEELKLLRPQHLQYNTTTGSYNEASIDANMLKKLADAGLSIGKNVSAKLPSVDIDADLKTTDLDQAIVAAEKLGLQGNSAIKIAQVISTLAALADKIVTQNFQSTLTNKYQYQNGHTSSFKSDKIDAIININNFCQKEGKITIHDRGQEMLKNILAVAVEALIENQLSHDNNNYSNNYNNLKNDDDTCDTNKRDIIFSAISEILKSLFDHNAIDIENLTEEFLQTLSLPQKRNAVCNLAINELFSASHSKIDILKSTLSAKMLKDEVILERFSQILENGDDTMTSAIKSIFRNDSKLMSCVIQKVWEEIPKVDTENEAIELVHKAIVQTVQEYSESHLEKMLNEEDFEVKQLLIQAVGLAKALGMFTTAESLLSVINDKNSTKILAGDNLSLDILKRLTVMRKLAEGRPESINALEDLSFNSAKANADPYLRTLIRESAVLMIVPEEIPLESSDDIPISLLCADNDLAVEDFIMRNGRKSSGAFLILKQGFQAVVPREAARSVLTGQAAYTLLDENGIKYFDPLHVFSALRLTQPAAHRFSMYCCPIVRTADEDIEIESEIISTYYERNSSLTSSASLDNSFISDRYSKYDCNGICFSKTNTSLDNQFFSNENTPSFRRISSLYQDNNNGVRFEPTFYYYMHSLKK